MTESYLWEKRVSPYFKKHQVHGTRHEDKLTLGVPDVSYGYNNKNGWIELKFLPRWPQSSSNILKLKKFKPEQRNFLRNRGKSGGRCFVLLMVGNKNPRDFVLWDWRTSWKIQKEELTVSQALQQSLFFSQSLEGLIEKLD